MPTALDHHVPINFIGEDEKKLVLKLLPGEECTLTSLQWKFHQEVVAVSSVVISPREGGSILVKNLRKGLGEPLAWADDWVELHSNLDSPMSPLENSFVVTEDEQLFIDVKNPLDLPIYFALASVRRISTEAHSKLLSEHTASTKDQTKA